MNEIKKIFVSVHSATQCSRATFWDVKTFKVSGGLASQGSYRYLEKLGNFSSAISAGAIQESKIYFQVPFSVIYMFRICNFVLS